MHLLTIGLAIKRSELLQEAESCCQAFAGHALIEQNDCRNWSSFLDWLGRLKPQVLLVDVEHFQNIVEERVRQIKAAAPESMIIALHHAADSQMIIAGMRAGIDEYLYPPFQKNLQGVVERKIDEHSRNQFVTNGERKTVAFLSAKGGCGGTTVACHIAAELGKRMNCAGAHHVLLADLDITGGNVRFLMRSKTPYSVLDAMGGSQGLTVTHWNKLVSNGYPGLEVISAPPGIPVERLPEQREVERVLNFARGRYQWTVLDLGCSLTAYTMSILPSINELYLVGSPDVLSLYQVKQIMRELQEANYPTGRLRLILNRSAEYEDRLVSEEAQKMLGVSIFCSLPNDYSGLSEAYASGGLLSLRSPLGRQLSLLATKISGIENPEEAGSSKQPWYRRIRVA